MPGDLVVLPSPGTSIHESNPVTMRGWPADADVFESFVELLERHPAHSWQRANLLSLKPSALMIDTVAMDILDAAHDIPDPRLRNGPWRPGWHPFGKE